MKKFLSLVLALVMTMSLVTVSAGAKDFTDNGSIKYKEAVEVMSAAKVVDGYTDGSFQPTTNLTRGAAAKIICNLILGPTTASALGADTAPYSDVPTSNVFAGYIAYCQKEGIISGYADGTFRPAAPLTGYAFMKMLLGALGYDGAKEGYTGANWSVNVAKQAIAIGLNKGNDEFVGQATVNREEAMLYAFNTMQATMVEYGNDTTITVGNVVVSQSGKASEVANTAATETIKNDNKMQFAEKYFSDLKLVSGTDAFGRPANIWKVKSDEIGTYAKAADATYTEKVKVGDIYKDLGLGKTVVKGDVTVYEDGMKTEKAVAISKGDDNNSYGGNGVLTQVYYNSDKETVTITLVNTYVGTINRTVAASGNNDAYVEVNPETNPSGGINKKFETNEKFDDDAYVLYTYSVSEKAIQSVKAAESVEGTVTKIVDSKSINLGDTTYKLAAVNGGATASVDSNYALYLDTYGYVVFVKEQEFVSSDYALVLATQGSGSFESNRAKLLFTDGTTKIVDTAKNYSGSENNIPNNTIVTYKKDDKNVYTLKKVTTNNGTQKVEDSSTFVMSSGTAKITLKSGTDVYSNSHTVFVVETGDSEYAAYTGTNNAPGIVASNRVNHKVDAYYFCKTGTMVTVMFIMPETGIVVENNSSNVLFIAGASASGMVSTSKSDYYEYNAVVNGEATTVKIDSGVANASKLGNSLYKSYSMDSNGVITKLNAYPASGDKYAASATGTAKVSGEYTVTLGNDSDGKISYTVANNAKIFAVDEDGKISSISINGIAKDTNDKAYFVVDNGQITYLFIQEVADGSTSSDNQAQLSKDVVVRKVDLEAGTTTIEYYREAGKQTLSAEDIYAILKDQGNTNVSMDSAGKWTFTSKSGLTYKDVTVAQKQVYKVVVGSEAAVYVEDGKTVKTGGDVKDGFTGKYSSNDGGKTFKLNSEGFTVAGKDMTVITGYYKVTANSTSAVSDISGSKISYTVNGAELKASGEVFVKDGAKVVVTVELGETGLTTKQANATLAVTGATAAVDVYATAEEGATAETVKGDTVTFPTSTKNYKGGVYTFTLTLNKADIENTATAVSLTNV